MKSTRTWIVLVFALALGFQQTYPGKVLGTTGQTCYPMSLRPVNTTPSMSVYGTSIENIDRAVTTVSGVSVAIVGKFNGQQNSSGPFAGKGRVDLVIITSNATPGKATVINLINDPDSGLREDICTFTISIIPPPTVERIEINTPDAPFGRINVTIFGTGFVGAMSGPATGTIIKNDPLIPFVTAGGDADVSLVRVLQDGALLSARISFTALIQDATVELTFQSNDVCVPLGVRPFKTRVRAKTENIRNYVKAITFPSGNTFDKNSNARILFNLLFPAPQSGGTPINDANRTVFFKLVPANAFTTVASGTLINAMGFTQVNANAGSNSIPITFNIADCLGGQPGTTNTVKIQTWMHNTNSTLPPEFVEQTFQVRCTQ